MKLKPPSIGPLIIHEVNTISNLNIKTFIILFKLNVNKLNKKSCYNGPTFFEKKVPNLSTWQNIKLKIKVR